VVSEEMLKISNPPLKIMQIVGPTAKHVLRNVKLLNKNDPIIIILEQTVRFCNG
jgi:hypothetical protein